MLRAADSDREHVADRLRHAAAEGRILTEELEERLDLAFAARTYGELDAVVSDLPAAPTRRHKTPLWAKATIAVAILMAVSVVFAVVALLFIGLAGAWLIWLFIAWAILGKGGGAGASRPRRHSRHAAYPRHRVNSTRGVGGGGSAWL